MLQPWLRLLQEAIERRPKHHNILGDLHLKIKNGTVRYNINKPSDNLFPYQITIFYIMHTSYAPLQNSIEHLASSHLDLSLRHVSLKIVSWQNPLLEGVPAKKFLHLLLAITSEYQEILWILLQSRFSERVR